MHQAMAATVEHCVERDPKRATANAVQTGVASRPRWPMIVLRSPKGWGAPSEVGGHRVEGFWRAHQVPLTEVKKEPRAIADPREVDARAEARGTVRRGRQADTRTERTRAVGQRRMSANPHANGGILKKALRLPSFSRLRREGGPPGRDRSRERRAPRRVSCRDVMKLNMTNFRVFGPDETTSNKLQAIYQVAKKFWIAEYFPEDQDGSELAPDGRVIEMLSEHTMEGMLEGYLLTGRNGFFSSYEAFVHVIDSMFNQHAKWLSICNQLSWRRDIASLNLLITSTVWRQDHNGFTHQDPGFLDVVLNKSAAVTRIYLPPDVNCLLSVADHCLRSENYINVIVSDKQLHLQYLDMEAAIEHCTKGIGIWDWASTDQGCEPDVVLASAGDIPTQEALAATALLREEFPDIKIRFINVVDLFKLQPSTEHPHGLSDRDFDSLFTTDKPIIFNFHGYPWLIHRLTYRRTNHKNLHVRGYKEKGNINTPMELAINNETDRFSLAIDAIDRVPKLQPIGAHAKEKFRNQQIACRQIRIRAWYRCPGDYRLALAAIA